LTKNGKGDDFWGNSKKDNHISSAYRDVKTQKKTKKPKRSSLNIEEHEG
jgi:hypothetical protein